MNTNEAGSGMVADYYFKEVNPMSHERYIHSEVRGKPCHIIHLKVGDRASIVVELKHNSGCFHTLHTSTVANYMIHNAGRTVTIETQNTIYVLEKIELRKEDAMDGLYTKDA